MHSRLGRTSEGHANASFILIIDEDSITLAGLSELLRGEGHRVARAASVMEARSILRERNLGVVLLGLGHSPSLSLDLLERIKGQRPDVALVATARAGGLDDAWQSRHRGAFEFIPAPMERRDELKSVVRSAVAHHNGVVELFRVLRNLAPEFASDPTNRVPHGPCVSASAPPRNELAALLRLARAAEGGRKPTVSGEWVTAGVRREEAAANRWAADPPLSLAAYERLALERALRENDGDATRAARSLGIGRSTFYRKAGKHGISLPRTEVGRPGSRSASASAGRGVGPPGPIG